MNETAMTSIVSPYKLWTPASYRAYFFYISIILFVFCFLFLQNRNWILRTYEDDILA